MQLTKHNFRRLWHSGYVSHALNLGVGVIRLGVMSLVLATQSRHEVSPIRLVHTSIPCHFREQSLYCKTYVNKSVPAPSLFVKGTNLVWLFPILQFSDKTGNVTAKRVGPDGQEASLSLLPRPALVLINQGEGGGTFLQTTHCRCSSLLCITQVKVSHTSWIGFVFPSTYYEINKRDY